MNLEKNLIPLFIMQTCKGREQYVIENKNKIPNLIVNYDDFEDPGVFCSTAWKNYMRGLKIAGDEATVQMDDDIILCDNFYEKILNEINKRPNDVIQFFSMRKDDLTIGSRYISGARFMMNQCVYLPAGLAKKIYDFSKEYEKNPHDTMVPIDLVMATYFKQKKIKYWNCVPNLVDHIEGKSAIDKRRSSKRQSLTFKK